MTKEELYNALLSPKPSSILKNREKELFCLIPELEKCKGFEQNSDWHIYDVYEHILHVIDNTSSNLVLRLAALFHDVGKPLSYVEDEKGNGHFYGHWEVSQRIFNEFASNHNIDINIRNRVSELIYYHDINLSKINNGKLKELIDEFDNEDIMLLFELKIADLLAQNKKYDYMLDEYEIQKKQLIKIKGGNNDERK